MCVQSLPCLIQHVLIALVSENVFKSACFLYGLRPVLNVYVLEPVQLRFLNM